VKKALACSVGLWFNAFDTGMKPVTHLYSVQGETLMTISYDSTGTRVVLPNPLSKGLTTAGVALALSICSEHGFRAHKDGSTIILHMPWTKDKLDGVEAIRVYSINQLYRELGY